ncbi:MAG: type II secretion system GspH family protein [Phycisphaerales bacterium]|nr:type II secretion system protein [Planctomycetota bacterium]MCH8509007.1 type II secretion system GspH family protein [Phycisphaerales bacterium]
MKHARRPSAFTLVEVLVSIGVIAVLIAILVPALGGAWTRARELKSSANLRSIGQLMDLYRGRADDLYPAPVPGRRYPSWRPDGLGTMGHWQASNYWPFLFSDTHPWWENEGLYLSPGAVRELDGRVVILPWSSYDYSASFLGDPAIWSGRPIADNEWPLLEKSVRGSTVVYPSSKALAWDSELPYLRRPLRKDAEFNLLEKTPILFADGHVAGHVPAEAAEAVPNRARYAAYPRERLHNTPDGVRGRDY